MGEVLSENFAKSAGDNPFTRPLRATERNRDADGFVGALDGKCRPSDKVIKVRLVPGTDDVENVIS